MNILFDLYGTLVDISTDEESEMFWRTLTSNGADFTREDYLVRCREETERLPKGGEIDLLKVFSSLTGKRGEELDAFARTFRKASVRRLKRYPYAQKLLIALRDLGAKVYLFSNAQACFTRDELRELELLTLFDGIVLSSELGWKKPSPKFFEGGMTRFGLNTKDCIYVGNDLRDDVCGAHVVGMRCLYIPTAQSGTYTPAQLAADMENFILLTEKTTPISSIPDYFTPDYTAPDLPSALQILKMFI